MTPSITGDKSNNHRGLERERHQQGPQFKGRQGFHLVRMGMVMGLIAGILFGLGIGFLIGYHLGSGGVIVIPLSIR